MKQQETPYTCHIFVCVKSRASERNSCGDGDNPDLKILLKEEIKHRGWKGAVRVSEASCLGQCETGPNIMLYPQEIWFSETTLADLPEILQTLEKLLNEA